MKSMVACGIFVSVLLMTDSTAWSSVQSGQSLFEKRCNACHKLPNPDQPPSEGWEQRLEIMAPMARLKADQKENILEYLLAHTQQSTRTAALSEDKILFEEKCSSCHTLDRIFLEPLTFESRRHVVSNMQKRSGTSWLSDEDIERILVYLDTTVTEARVAEPLPADAPAGKIFRTRCSACHTLERVYALLGKDRENQNLALMHTVSRMRDKAPQWMTETEAAEIIDYLKSLGQPAG